MSDDVAMVDEYTTSRRDALKFAGTAALASSIPLVGSSPGGAVTADEGPAYRNWIPSVDAFGDEDSLEFVHLDLERIREIRDLRPDDGIEAYLDEDNEEYQVEDLTSILRVPINITLSLTLSSRIGALFFGNIISVGWDDDEDRADISVATVLWFNGVTVIRGSFTVTEAVHTIREERDDYEQVGVQDGFELYERQHDRRTDLFDREGRSFAARDGTVVASLRQDGLDRVTTALDTIRGRLTRQHEADDRFEWATRDTSDCSITAGCVNSSAIEEVSLSDEVSELADASVLAGGVDLDGWNTSGVFSGAFDGGAPSDSTVLNALEERADLSITSDGNRLSLIDRFE